MPRPSQPFSIGVPNTSAHHLTAVLLKVALAVVFAAFGLAKFHAVEVAAVAPRLSAHPLLSWLPATLGDAGTARFLGLFDLATAALLLVGLRAPVAAALGGAMGVRTLLVTCSMLLVLPGVFEASAGGFPIVSGLGRFLLKDLVLLTASGAVLATSLAGVRTRLPGP